MIPDQRALFDIPDDVTYLNCAYLSPLLRESITAGKAGIDRKGHPWTIMRKDFFAEVEEVRALFAQLVNASAGDVAIVPASSYAAAIAGLNLPLSKEQSVVVVGGEHFSNVYQWKLRCRMAGARLDTVPEPTGSWTEAIIEQIGAQTAIVAVPQCHWHDGRLINLRAVGAAARRAGATLIVDGTQSIGAMPFDVTQIKPAFAFCSAYKWLLGPYGLAFLYVDPAYQGGMPLEHHSSNRVGADAIQSTSGYSDDFMPGARRYDFGERSNFILLPMVATALRRILDWGPQNISATLAPLVADISRRALGLGLSAPTDSAGHFTGLRFSSGMPAHLQQSLTDANVHVSVRGDRLRISPYLYNTTADIVRLFDALARIIAR